MKKLSDIDLNFKNAGSVEELKGPPSFTYLILWIALLFLVITLIWAKHSVIDEVTVGKGKVIPSSKIQVIQNLEGGIIEKIFVDEGEIVTKDQPLLQLDRTRFETEFKEVEGKINTLKITIARLEAEAENKPFIVPNELKNFSPTQVQSEQQLYQSRQEELKKKTRSYELAQQELEMTKPLVSQGAASPVEVLRQERVVNQLNSDISNFKSKALDDLSNAKASLASLQQVFLSGQDRLARTTIRSPLRGIVKQIKVTTVGGVIQPGMNVMEIVPMDDTLLIEAEINPKDIGFLHQNQKVIVKITAYDFTTYGGLVGVLEEISADTIVNAEGKSVYLIHARTDKNYLRTLKNPLYIIPGMLATVDILTGKKTVLNYILKPILKAQESALRER